MVDKHATVVPGARKQPPVPRKGGGIYAPAVSSHPPAKDGGLRRRLGTRSSLGAAQARTHSGLFLFFDSQPRVPSLAPRETRASPCKIKPDASGVQACGHWLEHAAQHASTPRPEHLRLAAATRTMPSPGTSRTAERGGLGPTRAWTRCPRVEGSCVSHTSAWYGRAEQCAVAGLGLTAAAANADKRAANPWCLHRMRQSISPWARAGSVGRRLAWGSCTGAAQSWAIRARRRAVAS